MLRLEWRDGEGLTIGVDVVDELTDLLGLSVHAKGLHGDLRT